MFIVKVPGISGIEKTRGCEKAGNAVLGVLKEIHSNEKGVPIDIRLLDLEEIHIDNSNPELTNKLIYENSLEIFGNKPKTVFLGGDRSISYPLIKAFLNYCAELEKKPCLIIFGARLDYIDTNKKSQMYVGWLKKLVEQGFPPENIFLVGVRNLDPSEISFITKKGIKKIGMNQLFENLEDSCDLLMEFTNGKELYVSIDIGVIDPAFAPGTNHKEPGGLTSREFLYLIQRINLLKNLRAVDIVGINPEEDIFGLTINLGAKILSELV